MQKLQTDYEKKMEEVLGTQKPQQDDDVRTRTQSMAAIYAKVERKN